MDRARAAYAVGDQEQLAVLLEESRLGALARERPWELAARLETAVAAEEREGTWLWLGDLLRDSGDLESALAVYEHAAPSAGAAWRRGLLLYLDGDLDGALAALDAGRGPDGSLADRALQSAWRATVLWARDDRQGCRRDADAALSLARRSRDDRALAAAWTAQALRAALDGDRSANEANYHHALRHAERAGDVLQTIRIRTNRGSRLNEEGSYQTALQELELAITLPGADAFTAVRALALANRGEAALHLGLLEQAQSDLSAARELMQASGSGMVADVLWLLGDTHRARGERALARAAYEEALHVAEQRDDRQAVVPALTGLARVLATDEPSVARQLAERALALHPEMFQVRALLAGAHVAEATDDAGDGIALAREAAAAARRHRDRPGLADALQLLARTRPAEERVEVLRDARTVWDTVQDPIGRARCDLELAQAEGGDQGLERAREARRTLRAVGARGDAQRADLIIAELSQATTAAVRVECLGGFRVLRGGVPVAASQWQSRKARTLLKLLISRRGRPVPRDVLLDALWPDERSDKAASRLSVALSTLRTVLDPGHRERADAYVSATRDAIRVEHGRVEVDVEQFLQAHRDARRLAAAGEHDAARRALEAAESTYRGDFLDEDLYDDWAAPLREEARAAYTDVLRRLAGDAVRQGDHEAATRRFLRMLEHDPYDEDVLLSLVDTLQAARRHGEARRWQSIHARRMAELELIPPDAGAA